MHIIHVDLFIHDIYVTCMALTTCELVLGQGILPIPLCIVDVCGGCLPSSEHGLQEEILEMTTIESVCSLEIG